MSDLRPTGVPLMVGGVKREILFTLNAIDKIQSETGLSMEEVIGELTIPGKSVQALKKILKCLLEDEVERKAGQETEFKKYTEEEIGWLFDARNIPEAVLAIFTAYGVSLPELEEEEEEENPNMVSGQQKN